MIKLSLVALSLMIMSALTVNTSELSFESNPATYQAYLSRSESDARQSWVKEVSDAAAQADKQPSNEDARFKLALVHYGLLNSTMRSKDEVTFKKYIDDAVANLEAIKGEHAGEAMAILGAVYGLQMAYDPSKGMFLGPRSSSLLSKARRADAASPLIWKLYGNSMYHTPEAYGGDVTEAISAYEKALALYDASPEKKKDNWMYIDTMAFLGQAYIRSNEPSKAVAIYEKALAAEPSFGWVKYKLLPAAQSKAK